MKSGHFCAGVLCLALVTSPTQAEIFTNFLGLFAKPSANHGVAVPRPVPGAEITPEDIEAGTGSEPGWEPLVEDARPKGGSIVSPDARSVPGWDGRRLSVIGIDRSDFPEILVLLQVRDPDGLPSLEVNLDGFEVTEDEAPQPITKIGYVTPARYPGDPINLAILIDSSGSMQGHMGTVIAAATRFIGRLRDDDEAVVVGFSSQPVLLSPLTKSKKRMIKGVNNLYPRGFTALYDAVCLGAENLRGCGGRTAMVLLTDGKDDDGTGRQLSHVSLEKSIAVAKKSRLPIYVIGIGSEIDRSVLERMASETGGEFLYAPTSRDVDDLYTEIARELGRGDEGYVGLIYHATESEKDGSTRTVIVEYAGANAVATYPAPKRFPWVF